MIGSMVLFFFLVSVDVNGQWVLGRLIAEKGIWTFLMGIGLMLWIGYIYGTQCLQLKDETLEMFLEAFDEEENVDY